jgi:hypothetical protein
LVLDLRRDGRRQHPAAVLARDSVVDHLTAQGRPLFSGPPPNVRADHGDLVRPAGSSFRDLTVHGTESRGSWVEAGWISGPRPRRVRIPRREWPRIQALTRRPHAQHDVVVRAWGIVWLAHRWTDRARVGRCVQRPGRTQVAGPLGGLPVHRVAS